MQSASLAVFPGTFDPFTLGHLDLCTRGLKLFSKVVVTVAKHHSKFPPVRARGAHGQ